MGSSLGVSNIKLLDIKIDKRLKQQLDEKGPAGSTMSSTSNNKPTLQEEEEDVLEKEYTTTIGNEEVKIQEWKTKIKIQTKNEELRNQLEAELQRQRGY